MTETTPKQIRPEQYQEYELTQIEDNPGTEYFEWKDDVIYTMCTSVVPNHPAYGMNFRDYVKNRNRVTDTDQEKIRLGFRLPSFVSHVSADMSIIYGMSYYHFLTMIIELGMIYFQKDYYEKYTNIKEFRTGLYNSISNTRNRELYEQLERQTIQLCDAKRKSMLVTPSVPEWLGHAVKNTAVYMNVSCSDFVNVLWCIGVQKSMDNIPSEVTKDIIITLRKFDFEMDMYSVRITQLTAMMNGSEK
jgi:hypothetical protein